VRESQPHLLCHADRAEAWHVKMNRRKVKMRRLGIQHPQRFPWQEEREEEEAHARQRLWYEKKWKLWKMSALRAGMECDEVILTPRGVTENGEKSVSRANVTGVRLVSGVGPRSVCLNQQRARTATVVERTLCVLTLDRSERGVAGSVIAERASTGERATGGSWHDTP